MSHEEEQEEISEAESLIQQIAKDHRNIRENEGELSKEQQALVEDVKKMKNGELTEDQFLRIYEELSQEEEDQQIVIEREEKSIKETHEALKKLRKTINKIKKNQKKEMENFDNAAKGLENALGSVANGLANGESVKDTAKNAASQMWKSVESMNTDLDEEEEVVEDLDLLAHDIGKSVEEDEELLKKENTDYKVEQFLSQVLENYGAEEEKEKVQEQAEKDSEERDETVEEISQERKLAKEEEEDINELYQDIRLTINEANEMIEDINELQNELKEAPANNETSMKRLSKMKKKLRDNREEAKKALEKINQETDFMDSVESEISRAENAA